MKLGILDADRLDPRVIDRFGRYSDMFIRALSEREPALAFKVYSVIDCEYPNNIDECDAYLLTGSQYSAYDDRPWVHRLSHFIRQLAGSNKTLIGICFGHQMIAQSLGGRVEKSPQGWRMGVETSNISQLQPWMVPAEQKIRLRVSHQDQVSQLPDTAKLIASNEHCPIAAYQMGRILCFQGHPEFSNEYLRHIIQSRISVLGKDLSERAMASLRQDTESRQVLQWLIEFMKLNSHS